MKASLKELSVVFIGVYIKDRDHGEEACIALDVDFEQEAKRGRKGGSAGWEKRMMEADLITGKNVPPEKPKKH